MPPKSPESFLFDILEAARKIERFTAGYDEERFKQDEKTVSAVERQFMIIGEAAQHVNQAFVPGFQKLISGSRTQCAISLCIIMIALISNGSGEPSKKMFQI